MRESQIKVARYATLSDDANVRVKRNHLKEIPAALDGLW